MTRPFCQTCAKKYMRQLWEGSCICTGHVSLSFQMPGSGVSMPVLETPKSTAVTKPSGLKLIKKEKARLAKHGYFL